MRALWQEIPQPSITKISLEITYLRSHSEANDLAKHRILTTPKQLRLQYRWLKVQFSKSISHDDVMMETFSALLALVRGIHRPLVNSPRKGQWRGSSMFSLICASINGWVNNRDAGDLRCNWAHYDVIVVIILLFSMCVVPAEYSVPSNHVFMYHVFSHCVCMLFLLGWPPCQRSDMTLMEVSQRALDSLHIRNIWLLHICVFL